MSSLLDPRRGARVERALAWPVALLALGACARSSDVATSDSSLSRDLTLAATVGQRAAPADSLAFADTAITRPAAVRPAAVAAVPAPAPTPAPAAATPRRTPPPVPTPAATVASAATAPAPKPDSAASPATPAPIAAPASPTPVGAAVGAAIGASTGPAAGTRTGTFGIGTSMALSTTQAICTTTNHVGDRFVATLAQTAMAQDGSTLPAGTNVVLEVTAATTGADGRAHMELVARGITLDGFSRPLMAEVSDVDRELHQQRIQTPGHDDRATVGKGALTGALLGRIFSRGVKGAVIGAAAGAAVGAATTVSSKNVQGCLPRGSAVLIRLTEPLATA